VPRRRATSADLALRDGLAIELRRELGIAERFEQLGDELAGTAIRGKLDALAAGLPVVVRSDTLASALDHIGAPLAIVRDVLTGRADHYAVEPDGTYDLAR
jgi:hypothetical protein